MQLNTIHPPLPVPAAAEHLEVIQRAMLRDIAEYMDVVRSALTELHERADMSAGEYAETAVYSVRQLRGELNALDAIGWPTAAPIAGLA